jgi:two-component system, NarL family, sensor kinase
MSFSRAVDGQPEPPFRQESSIRSDERHRIAREVHDSTSQLLVVVQLQLGHLKRLKRPDAASIIAECERTIDEIREHIRALDLDGH